MAATGDQVTDPRLVLGRAIADVRNRYASKTKIVFGLMNEPHDVPDIDKWAATVQEAVTAIRGVAKTQMILLPGNEYVPSQHRQ